MPPLPSEIITVLGAFAPLFSRPVWRHAQLLLAGALLCQGPQTVPVPGYGGAGDPGVTATPGRAVVRFSHRPTTGTTRTDAG